MRGRELLNMQMADGQSVLGNVEDAEIASLETALAAHPDDRDILQALASFHAERDDAGDARDYTVRLQGLSE